jgi:hypothetical protein
MAELIVYRSSSRRDPSTTNTMEKNTHLTNLRVCRRLLRRAIVSKPAFIIFRENENQNSEIAKPNFKKSEFCATYK